MIPLAVPPPLFLLSGESCQGGGDPSHLFLPTGRKNASLLPVPVYKGTGGPTVNRIIYMTENIAFSSATYLVGKK